MSSSEVIGPRAVSVRARADQKRESRKVNAEADTPASVQEPLRKADRWRIEGIALCTTGGAENNAGGFGVLVMDPGGLEFYKLRMELATSGPAPDTLLAPPEPNSGFNVSYGSPRPEFADQDSADVDMNSPAGGTLGPAAQAAEVALPESSFMEIDHELYEVSDDDALPESSYMPIDHEIYEGPEEDAFAGPSYMAIDHELCEARDEHASPESTYMAIDHELCDVPEEDAFPESSHMAIDHEPYEAPEEQPSGQEWAGEIDFVNMTNEQMADLLGTFDAPAAPAAPLPAPVEDGMDVEADWDSWIDFDA
jgi:hypothetical protein